MPQVVRAVFENGIPRPLDHLDLDESQQVRITVEPAETPNGDDPLGGLRVATGVKDLAEHFDDYCFGRRKP
jgi:predicted DNA-binding antitoxin AbrB/MazE fold protein